MWTYMTEHKLFIFAHTVDFKQMVSGVCAAWFNEAEKSNTYDDARSISRICIIERDKTTPTG